MVHGLDNNETTETPHRRRPAAALVRRISQQISELSRSSLDLVFPPLCLGCETRLLDHHALCASCWRSIDFIRPPVCDRLGVPLSYAGGDGAQISAAAAANPPVYDRARAVARYDGLMRELIHRLKYGDRHEARRLFARWLVDAGAELIAETDVIVPIPLSRWRLLQRRFNQAQILGSDLSRLTSIPVDALALTRRHRRAHQVDLAKAERQRNVAGVYSVSAAAIPRIAGRRVLLVDDVITTGATVSSAARSLKTAGAANVNVLALAITWNR